MKISFTIDNLDDAELAECHCIAIADVFRMAEAPVVEAPKAEVPIVEAPPAKKRDRPKKTAAATPPVESAVSEPDEDPELAREKFRAIAAERGVVWLRPILIQYGAERFGDLTDQQVIEALRAAAA